MSKEPQQLPVSAHPLHITKGTALSHFSSSVWLHLSDSLQNVAAHRPPHHRHNPSIADFNNRTIFLLLALFPLSFRKYFYAFPSAAHNHSSSPIGFRAKQKENIDSVSLATFFKWYYSSSLSGFFEIS
jgi:hypothetical protein